MDWTAQTEEMYKTWADTQKQVWDNWVSMVTPQPSQNQAADMWKKTLDTWQETVDNTLAAQAKWTEAWGASIDTENGTPEEMAKWIKQTQDMTKQWNSAQEQLWQNWFDLIKKAEWTQMTGNWEEEGQKAFQTWQDATQKVMDAQMEWVKMWAPAKSEA